MVSNYRVILSVDGCGFNGVIPLQIIDLLNDELKKYFPCYSPIGTVDLFTSCSTSTIFTGALMLTDNKGNCLYSPKDLLDFYKRRGKSMFNKNISSNPEHSNYPLKFVLEHFFGDIKLKDLTKHFLFFSYNITNDNIFYFSKQNYRLYDLSLSKMMYACTVDDLYYPPIKIFNSELCDVSSFLINPSCLGYNYLKMLYPDDYIILLSIGVKNCSKDKRTHFFQQKEEVHNKMLEIAEKDFRLKYFRFQPEVNSLNLNPETYNDFELMNFIKDYLNKNKFQIEQIVDLFNLKYA